jgi:hypothetical protein
MGDITALILEQLLHKNIVVTHAVLVQLAHLNPVFLDFVQLFGLISDLLFAPLWALLLKDAEEERLVLFIACEEVDILVDVTLDLLYLSL